MCEGPGGAAELNCIFPIIANIILWLLYFSGVVAVVLIIYSGIMFIASGGDAKRIDTARKTFIYAILGLLLVFFAFMIVNEIAYFTGLACIKPINPLSFQSCQ